MKLLNTSQKLIKPRMTINLMIGKNVEVGKSESVKIGDNFLLWEKYFESDDLKNFSNHYEDVDRLTFWKLVATNDVE